MVIAALALPLFGEFSEPGQTAWNVFLVVCLVALVVAAFFLQRFFVTHADELGEARFDTRNKDDLNG